MNGEFELVVTIFKRGFSDVVMQAARSAGATGGTVFNARGAGAHDAEKFFGITIQPEKEILMILVEKEKRNAVMQAISKSAGLNTEGQGLSFSLPVEDVLGVTRGINQGGTEEKELPPEDEQNA